MYYNKETFKELATRMSKKLDLTYLSQCLSKMSKNIETEELIHIALLRDSNVNLDITQCYDILSQQMYGHDWNFISNQFDINNSLFEKAKQFLDKCKKSEDYDIPNFTKDRYSKMSEQALLDQIFDAIVFKKAELVAFGDLDPGYTMKGTGFLYAQSGYFKPINDDSSDIRSGSIDIEIDARTGEVKSIIASCSELDLGTDYSESDKFIGNKYPAFVVDEVNNDNYYIVATQRVGDTSYLQLIDTISIDEGDALNMANEIAEISPNLTLLDKHHLSADYAWNIIDDKPVVKIHGKSAVCVNV